MSDGGSVPKRTPSPVQTQTEKGQPHQPKVSWVQRNIKWLSLFCAVCITAILIAVIVPTALLVIRNKGVSPPPPYEHSPPPYEHNPGYAPPLRDLFNNTARANAHVPPLSEPFPYGKIPIRGINLGGWLVTEPFIVPSLYDQFPSSEGVVDEWTLCEKLGPDEARRQLEHHYDTFITEQDFARIAAMGFNHVRIPTGHWAVAPVPGEPFVPHVSWQYLLRAVQWARKYGLRVMVELHTAPGSQNGWNHSGRKGPVGWLNGTHGTDNAQRTIEVVKHMARFFSKPAWKDVAPIFGVLNEPAIFRIRTERVQDWYHASHDAIRNASYNGGPYLTYHDGFIGLDMWNGFFDKAVYDRVFLETHMYLIFDDTIVSMPRDKQAKFPCGVWRKALNESMRHAAPTMVGEFSVATNDCGKYLNGVGLGTRYEGTLREGTSFRKPVCNNCTCAHFDDWAHWDDNYKRFLNSFVEHQMDAFETSSVGWFFWTYKTENHINPHWDYLLGWQQGWIPKDANVRSHFCDDDRPSAF